MHLLFQMFFPFSTERQLMVKLEQFPLEHQALMCMKGYRVNNGGVSLSLISFHFISHQFLSWDLKLMTMEELEWVVFMLPEWVLSYFQCIEVTLVNKVIQVSSVHYYYTSSAYCPACPAPRVRFSSVTIYLAPLPSTAPPHSPCLW